MPQSPTKPSPLRCTDPAVQVMRSGCVRKVFLADTKYFRDRFIPLGVPTACSRQNRVLIQNPTAELNPDRN